MYLRLGAYLDLAIRARNEPLDAVAEQLNLSQTAVSNYTLAMRFPRDPGALVSGLIRYVSEVIDISEDEASQLRTNLLTHAYEEERRLRFLFDHPLIEAALTRGTAQLIAKYVPTPAPDFRPEEAQTLLRLLTPVPVLSLVRDNYQDFELFARYIAHRVQTREHYFLDLFGHNPQRIEIPNSFPPPVIDPREAVAYAFPTSATNNLPSLLVLKHIHERGLAMLAVPALKMAASLDVLSWLVDTLRVDLTPYSDVCYVRVTCGSYGVGPPADRPAEPYVISFATLEQPEGVPPSEDNSLTTLRWRTTIRNEGS